MNRFSHAAKAFCRDRIWTGREPLCRYRAISCHDKVGSYYVATENFLSRRSLTTGGGSHVAIAPCTMTACGRPQPGDPAQDRPLLRRSSHAGAIENYAAQPRGPGAR